MRFDGDSIFLPFFSTTSNELLLLLLATKHETPLRLPNRSVCLSKTLMLVV
jgi:hypothetical protein